MKKLGSQIKSTVARLGKDQKTAKLHAYILHVYDEYKKVLESVYRDNAEVFLDHTNAVYLKRDGKIKELTVYVDQSIFAAELNSQRELIKLKFLELFKEPVETFNIKVSSGKYKKNYPFKELKKQEEKPLQKPVVNLNENEKCLIKETEALIENDTVRKAFEKAMKADIKRIKNES